MTINADLLANGYLEQSRDPLSSYIHTRLDEQFPFLQNDSEAKVILRALIYDLATLRREPDELVYWLAKHFYQKSMLDSAYLPKFDQEKPEEQTLANSFLQVLDRIYQAVRGLEEDERKEFLAQLAAEGYYGLLTQLLLNFVSFDLVMLKCVSYFYPEIDYKQALPLVLTKEQADYLRQALQSYLKNEGVVGFTETGLEIDTKALYSYFKKHPTNLFAQADEVQA
ncbi:hypothetical protein CJP74_07715 [Psittacicella melopsittaci]|uniref:Uncharacterized protein n=1 Tax=Psittacicella melopsittaci TaxID=2028576 RepID=A0A3A1Y534_9GAMM|nr:hypothetical protein [Psittacicella melopsittaci]RIY31277.1 hypothetical protein CJP74_07715 [Psittacicella melopsittaci]